MKLKTRTETMIDVSDWDTLVMDTYDRPYSFQQQDDCKSRGIFRFEVPADYTDDFENDTIPEIVNYWEMGVSFKSWLERDPKQLLPIEKYAFKATDKEIKSMRENSLGLWWVRNFYPEVGMVINDLHKKGLLNAGKYIIDIDW